MTEPFGPVIITGREVYDAVVRLTGRVDVLIEQHNGLVRDQQEYQTLAADRHQDHEGRIRAIERRMWPLPAVSILIAVAALLVPLIRGG